jgi:hypothetical protein
MSASSHPGPGGDEARALRERRVLAGVEDPLSVPRVRRRPLPAVTHCGSPAPPLHAPPGPGRRRK